LKYIISALTQWPNHNQKTKYKHQATLSKD
jgi:hypothetical protein